MQTYDYYKNQETHELHAGAKFYNEDGNVFIEVNRQFAQAYGYPKQLDKGVWSVNGSTYVPEGAPNYDKDAEQLVWGRTIASRAACEGKVEGLYSKKLIEQSRKYWESK